jgi:outer membrane receptor for ferrienterochelin and colicins
VVNLFTEDHAALTGARQIIIAEKLDPEESWNVNLNYNRVYSLGQLGYGIIDADVFHTWFSNKIVPDYTVDPNLIVYENLTGQGISRGASLSLTHTFSTKSEFSVAGTYLNVYEVWSDAEKENQLLTPTLSAKMRYKWQSPWWDIAVNYSALITGPMHLPQYEGEFSRSATSSTFSLHHIKFSREFNHWEVYLGIKNIFNYTQESPLVDPANPFGTNFDTAYAYGPLQTRRYMLGASFKIDRKP